MPRSNRSRILEKCDFSPQSDNVPFSLWHGKSFFFSFHLVMWDSLLFSIKLDFQRLQLGGYDENWGARAKALREMMGPQRAERQRGGLVEVTELTTDMAMLLLRIHRFQTKICTEKKTKHDSWKIAWEYEQLTPDSIQNKETIFLNARRRGFNHSVVGRRCAAHQMWQVRSGNCKLHLWCVCLVKNGSF